MVDRTDSIPPVTAALAQYEISSAMRAKVEDRFGNAVYLSISEIKRNSIKTILSSLRLYKVDRAVVVIETEGGLQIAPILKLLSVVIPAREYFMFLWDNRIESFSRAAQAITLLKIGTATFRSWIMMRHVRAKAERLLSTPKLSSHVVSGRKAVAFINGNLSFGLMTGGSIGHIAGVGNAFEDAGLKVKYFGSSRIPTLRANQVPLIMRYPVAVPPEINQYTFGFDTVKQIDKLIDGSDCAFVYQRLSLGNYSGVELSRKMKVPLIVEYNGSEIWITNHWGNQVRYDRAARAAEEAMLRHAHIVVTISAPLRDELLSRGVEPERIVLYPNCIDPIIFDPSRFSGDETRGIRRQLDVAEDACVVMFVGTFGLWHGAEVLAEAILHIAEREPARLERSKAVFVFVGAGVTLPKVQAALAAPAVARFVRFTGLVPQEHAPAYLAAADICVSPHVANPDGSRFFGSPTKLFEYMAMAKPIVASNLEQIGEVLSPGIGPDGIRRGSPINDHPHALAALTTPGCVEELARAILFLAESPDWRHHLGGNARAEALAKYTWRAHVGAILDAVSRIGG